MKNLWRPENEFKEWLDGDSDNNSNKNKDNNDKDIK